MTHDTDTLHEGQRVIYEGEDNGFVIGGPNQYRGTITELIPERSIVIVDGIQEVPLDRITDINPNS